MNVQCKDADRCCCCCCPGNGPSVSAPDINDRVSLSSPKGPPTPDRLVVSGGGQAGVTIEWTNIETVKYVKFDSMRWGVRRTDERGWNTMTPHPRGQKEEREGGGREAQRWWHLLVKRRVCQRPLPTVCGVILTYYLNSLIVMTSDGIWHSGSIRLGLSTLQGKGFESKRSSSFVQGRSQEGVTVSGRLVVSVLDSQLRGTIS